IFKQDAENATILTRPAPTRRDAPLPRLRSRLESILNGDPAASPLGGAHRRGAPYSSHRAPQRVRLRCFFRLLPRWAAVLNRLREIVMISNPKRQILPRIYFNRPT